MLESLSHAVGHLELRVVDLNPLAPASASLRFLSDGELTDRAVVQPQGSILGRNEKADLVLAGPGSDYISNFHLFVGYHAAAGLWIARDHDSTHGTAASRRGETMKLFPGVPVPLSPGTELRLANVVQLSVTRVRPKMERTRGAAGSGEPQPSWFVDEQELCLIEFLLSFAREGRLTSEITESIVVEGTGIPARTAHRRRASIVARPEIQRLLPPSVDSLSFAGLAEALPRAFPHLMEP